MRSCHIRALSAAALLAIGLPAQAAGPLKPSQWEEFGGRYHRIEADGNFSCYSEDGTNCKYSTPSSDKSVIKPLVCGEAHAKKWGGKTGYDSPGHWCNDAYANLFVRWSKNHFVEAQSNRPIIMSKNANGDPMCLSTNSKECLTGDALTEYMKSPKPISPLVCGDAHFHQHGVTGYEPSDRRHWCQSPEPVKTWLIMLRDSNYSMEQRNTLENAGILYTKPPVRGDTFSLTIPEWDISEKYTFAIKAKTTIWPQLSLSDKSGNTYLAKSRPEEESNFGEMMMILDFNQEGGKSPTLATGVVKPLGAPSPLNNTVVENNNAKTYNELSFNFPRDSVERPWNSPASPWIYVQVMKPRAAPKILPKSLQH